MFVVTVVPTNGNIQVYQWANLTNSAVYVLVVFSNPPSSSTLIIGSLNVAALAQSYISDGFSNFQQASFQTSVANASPVGSVSTPPTGISATFAQSAGGVLAT